MQTRQKRTTKDNSQQHTALQAFTSALATKEKEQKMKDKNVIELKDMSALTKSVTVTIEGDGDIVLNKMNARNTRELSADDRNTSKEVSNPWEDIITSIHWRDKLETENTYTDCDEEMMHHLLETNAPCIPAFALKKAFGDAVVRNGIDTYKTKFDCAMNIVANNGRVPITFAEWSLDERLMSPKKGKPVLVRLNHFGGWKAEFRIDYTENVYTLNELIHIINLAGFSLGVGSGRTSGYGRFHVVDVR